MPDKRLVLLSITKRLKFEPAMFAQADSVEQFIHIMSMQQLHKFIGIAFEYPPAAFATADAAMFVQTLADINEENPDLLYAAVLDPVGILPSGSDHDGMTTVDVFTAQYTGSSMESEAYIVKRWTVQAKENVEAKIAELIRREASGDLGNLSEVFTGEDKCWYGGRHY